MRTLKELAQESLDVQNACNLSGVAQGFARMIIELRQVNKLDTDGTNTHPIVILWLDKMNSLAGIQSFNFTDDASQRIADAYNAVTAMTKDIERNCVKTYNGEPA